MDNKALLQDCCQQMQVNLTEDMAEKFMTYMDIMLKWNETVNLTAIREEREVVLRHFADCLSIVPYLTVTEDTTIIDVGTGAGFPGLPVKIVYPEVGMTLLDSLQKRITFLEEATKKLSLTQVDCVHARAEDGGKNPLYREQFDYCVSRAVANLAVLAEYCLPFVKVGGALVALKGPEITEELANAAGALEKLGGKVSKVVEITIPHTDLVHTLVFIEKVASTPMVYPRKAGKVGKKPLV